MAETLLLSDNDLTENTFLGGNIDVDKYRPCIVDAQLSKVIEILGEDLYEKMKTDFPVYTGLYETMYDDYLKPMLIRQAACEYVLIGAYTVANGGIFKFTPTNGTPAEKNEVDQLANNLRIKAEMYGERLEKWLCKFGSGIPEYNCGSDNIVNPSRNNQQGGWFIGNTNRNHF